MSGRRDGKRAYSQSDYGDDGGKRRRNPSDERDRDRDREREQFIIDSDDTVYRYLCPGRKIGSVIGRGGEIVKQLRIDTKSRIRIGDTVPGCEQRVITIYSSGEEMNSCEDGDRVCPAEDALFKIHERVVDDLLVDGQDGDQQVTARLLVPSDQIGCVIGKGGQIVQSIRTDTGANVRILKDNHLPSCALSSDELVQISGEAAVVKKALFQIATRLHDNPSRSQHLLGSAQRGMFPSSGEPLVGVAPLVRPYQEYRDSGGDWPWRSIYSAAPRDVGFSKEFSLRLICAVGDIGGVIGKDGLVITQIRQESGASIKVDSSKTERDDCLITISAKEVFEEVVSPTIDAAVRLQPRCSDREERDSGLISFTTRLLVPTSSIGCLIGKGGAIITEMRRNTKANIRILSKENLPKIAGADDEMVKICGDLDTAKEALIQVATRLRANVFDRESSVSTYVPVLPYVPVHPDGPDGYGHNSRDSRRSTRRHSYTIGYGGSSDLVSDTYGGGYSSPHIDRVGGGGSVYGVYGGGYSSGRSTISGFEQKTR